MIVWVGSEVLGLISGVCLIAAGLGCLVLLLAAAAVCQFTRRRDSEEPRLAATEPVTLLKPLHGAEPDLARRLLSFCDQDYGAPLQMLCGVRDPNDEAIAEVDEARRNGSAVAVVVDARQRGSNPKIANLLNIVDRADHDLLVIADSDIEVKRDYLRRVVAALQQRGVGAVTCLYHGTADGGFWARQSALGINSHFLPNVLLGLCLGLAKPCFGSTIALRRNTLYRIGGFAAFADSLADDYEIGAAVRAAGYEVAIPPLSIAHACFERSLSALWAHDLRAARTIKSIDPAGYYGAAITHPLPLALLALCLGGGIIASILVASALVCRGLLCLCVERAFTLTRQPYWLIPLRDILLLAVYVHSLFGAAVHWRGASFRVGLDGRLLPRRKRVES